jgi:hypothetical protein
MLSTAQSPVLRFEVTSVKPHEPNASGRRGGLCAGSNTTVSVSSMGAGGVPSTGQVTLPPGMCTFRQTLLRADRFGLRVHRETREVDGFALTLAARGSKLPIPTAHHSSRRSTSNSVCACRRERSHSSSWRSTRSSVQRPADRV